MLGSVKYWALKVRRKKLLPIIILAFLMISATLSTRICAAYFLANDDPNDEKIYTQIAVNLLERRVFSIETESPYTPTLIRLPGYPLFLAGVYAIFGHGNNTAARIVQAIFDTGTCILVALLAWTWTDDEKLKRQAAFWAFILASICPFTVIFTATILTETLTTFLLAAMTLAVTFAFRSDKNKSKLFWWILAGLLIGAAVTLRPDSGLFALGIGLALVVAELFFYTKDDGKLTARLVKTIWQGAVFSLAFILPLVPWTIRNEQTFGIFQPLAPAHAEMPGEFVAFGYFKWLRTWIDDEKYIEPTLWNLEEKPIDIKQIPATAFDSEEEKTRVAALLNQYNHPPNAEKSDDAPTADNSDDESDDSVKNDGDNDQNIEDDSDNVEDSDQPEAIDYRITPEMDAEFEQIAEQRIARAPFHYYFTLPVKRAATMWFDTHSAYFPFAGELFPLKDLDEDENQQIWLPIFAVLTWIYTLLATAGAFVLWRKKSYRWLMLSAFLIFPRIVFFSTLENPEPRYFVELFIFTAIIGGIALSRIKFRRGKNYFSIRFLLS